MSKGLHVALIRAAGSHKKACRKEFLKMNLSEGQPKVLSFLKFKEGYLQKELAFACHVEPATMTSILKIMEKNNLIEKRITHVSGGKKAYQIYLTEFGRKKAEEVDDYVDILEEESLNGLSDEEQDLLISLLNRVADNLNQI